MNEVALPEKIYTSIDQNEKAIKVFAATSELMSQVEKLKPIESDDEASRVGEFRHQLKQRAKELEAERKLMVDPALQLQRMLNGKFKPKIEEIESVVSRCDKLILSWAKEQERIKREQEEAARKAQEEEERLERERIEAERQQELAETQEEAEAAKKMVEETSEALKSRKAYPAAPTVTPGKIRSSQTGASVSTRDNWKYKVVDISLVPEEYLVDPAERVKKMKLNSIAKQQQESASVPGIEFYNEPVVSSR